MEVVCFADGNYTTKDKVRISIDDFGFARGYTLFEHFKTYHSKPFHSEDHLRRLFHAANYFYIDVPYSIPEIHKVIEKLHEINQFCEAGYKIYLTAGPCESYLNFPKKPSFYVIPYAINTRPSPLSDNVFVTTTNFYRTFAEHKTANYLSGIKAHLDAIKHAEKEGSETPIEVIYLDQEENLLEGSFSSFLAFDKDTLIVPKSNMLPSITQHVLLKIAKNHFTIKHDNINYSCLPKLSEVLFASSVSEIRSIRKLDNLHFPLRKNVPILKELFNDYIEKMNWPLLEQFSYEPLATSSL